MSIHNNNYGFQSDNRDLILPKKVGLSKSDSNEKKLILPNSQKSVDGSNNTDYTQTSLGIYLPNNIDPQVIIE